MQENRPIVPAVTEGCSKDGPGPFPEDILNQILEAQVTEQPGTERCERNIDRAAYRNGVRPRTMYTRVGKITLKVPQLRDRSFSTKNFGYLPVRRAGPCNVNQMPFTN